MIPLLCQFTLAETLSLNKTRKKEIFAVHMLLDLNNSLFCLSVTGLSGEKIMVKKAEKRGQKTL